MPYVAVSSDIPMPDRVSNANKYQFELMKKVGDSIFIVAPQRLVQPASHAYGKTRGLSYATSKRVENGMAGTRVWLKSVGGRIGKSGGVTALTMGDPMPQEVMEPLPGMEEAAA